MRAAFIFFVAAAAVAAQPPIPERQPAAGRRIAILYRDALPTERQIVEELRRVLPVPAELIPVEPLDAAVDRLRGIDREGFEALVALGRRRAILVMEHVRTARLVLGGDLGSDPESLLGSAGARPAATSLHPLDVDPDAVARARAVLLPEITKIAAIAPAGRWSGVAPVVLSTPWKAGMTPEAFIGALRPQVDGLFLPEDEDLLAVSGPLLDAARHAHLAVITSSPWLSRSGAALGVVPDLSTYAIQLAARARGSRPGGDTVRPPVLRILDLDALQRSGLPRDVLRLARADVVREGRTGEVP